MHGFRFSHPLPERLAALFPLATAIVVSGYAVRLTLQNHPPPERWLKGAAIVAGFDLLATVTALLWWRTYVVFDDIGVRFRNLLRERSLRFDEIESISAQKPFTSTFVFLKRRRGWGIFRFSKIAALTACPPFSSRGTAAQYRGLADACRAHGVEAGPWPS